MSRVEAISAAVEAACEGVGEDITVDLDAFEKALKRAKVPVRKANKAVLNAELQATREEIRVQSATAQNADGDPAPLRARIAELEERENELAHQLWPPKEA